MWNLLWQKSSGSTNEGFRDFFEQEMDPFDHGERTLNFYGCTDNYENMNQHSSTTLLVVIVKRIVCEEGQDP